MKFEKGSLIRLERDVVAFTKIHPYPNPDDRWVLAKGQILMIVDLNHPKYYPHVSHYECFTFIGPGKCFIQMAILDDYSIKIN